MIEVDALQVRRDNREILRGISLRVGRGELVGVIGPNGAGKTTLLRTIDGLIPPAGGAVRIDGTEVQAMDRQELSRLVAVVPQSTHIEFAFTVRQVVAMGRTPYRGRFSDPDQRGPQRVEDALQRADIAHLADRPITDISGGERRRVVLARALAQDTPAMLLDEPTANLDINYQIATLESIADAVDAGTAALAAIHDLDLAARYCDRLVLLGEDQTVATGTPEEVLRPDPIERAFDATAIVHTNPLTGDRAVIPTNRREPRDGTVAVLGGGGTAAPMLRHLVRAGYEVSVGVLREGGVDREVAEALGCESVTAPAAGPLPSHAKTRMADLIDRADATVLTEVPIDGHNAGLLELAARSPRLVVLEHGPSDDRMPAGEALAHRYRTLRLEARVTTMDDFANVLAEALSGEDGSASAKNPHREL